MFINYLPLLLDYCCIDFADDVTYHTNGKTKAKIESKLQHGSYISRTWAEQNKILIHYDKTTCMVIGTIQIAR